MTVDGRRSHDPRPEGRGLSESEYVASNGDIYIRVTAEDDAYDKAMTNPPFGESLDDIPQLPLPAPHEDDRRGLGWARLVFAGETRSGRAARSDPPGLALRLFTEEDAVHYAREWRAHLSELIVAGEYRQARLDRWRMAWGPRGLRCSCGGAGC